MSLSRTQLAVLSALAVLEPAQARSVRQLSEETGLAASTVRAALNAHSYMGWALSSRRSPANWRITALGRAVLSAPRYRDVLSHRSRR
ncbi:hypothetical protein ACQPW1_21625 [Nocardia sp. CA-128927]|uniref:hypothetical protein n=1 Tax=Nocardia sp. CA-128927 TaxID=3239975 RepID=UPI003D981AD4